MSQYLYSKLKAWRTDVLSPVRALCVLLCCASVHAWAAPPADSAAVNVTTLSEIRRELACYCGCGMTVQDCLGGMVCSESRNLSKEVAQLLQEGKNSDQVLQAMVVKYGERILSAPTKQGFNLMAWVLPFVALALGGAVVGVVVKRWRRQSSAAPVATPENRAASSSADPYGARFEEEFRKFES